MYDLSGYMQQYGSGLPSQYTMTTQSSPGSALMGATDLSNLGSMRKKEWRAFKKNFDPSQYDLQSWENAVNTAQSKKSRKRLKKLNAIAGFKPFQIAQNKLEDFNNEMWDTADDVFGEVEDWATSPDEAVSYFDKINEAQDLVNKQFDVGEGSYQRDMMRLGMNPERADEGESRSRRTSLARAIAQVDASNRQLSGLDEIRAMRDQFAFDELAATAGAEAQARARMADLEAQRESAYQQNKAAKSAGTLGMIGQAIGTAAMIASI